MNTNRKCDQERIHHIFQMAVADWTVTITTSDEDLSNTIRRGNGGMVLTGIPAPLSLDPNYEWVQTRRDNFERAAFPAQEHLDIYQHNALDAYVTRISKCYNRDTLNVARSLGDTQQDLAEVTNTDRSTFSVAKIHGELGGKPLTNILADDRIQLGVFARMITRTIQSSRLGFIDAAKITAGAGGLTSDEIDALSVVDHELIRGLFDVSQNIDPEKNINDAELNIVRRRILDEPALCLIPEWYTSEERSDMKTSIEKIRSFAYVSERLRELQRRWIDVYVYTWVTIENLADPDLRRRR